jgi:molybdopterin-guanine dinucleotide biosynthesis protein B
MQRRCKIIRCIEGGIVKNTEAVVLAVCGRKNTGKTTLIEGVIPLLSAAGRHVAVVKHHGHELDPDVPGTDTYRFYHAGAIGTVITDDNHFALVRRAKNDVAMLIEYFPDADLIILEGYKDTMWPRIEMLRGGAAPESDPSLLIGIAGDMPDNFGCGNIIPVLQFRDFESTAKLILDYCRKCHSTEK